MSGADSSRITEPQAHGGGAAPRRLRIGIDAHAIGSRLGGNETYILDVLRGLDQFPQHNYFIYVTDEKAAEIARTACASARALRLIGHANPLIRLGYKLSALARRDELDVLHVQYVAPIFAPAIVASIHDLSFAHFPEWFTRGERLRFQLTVPWTARRARRILTISDYSRQDIIRTFRVPPEKVTFCHLWPARHLFEARRIGDRSRDQQARNTPSLHYRSGQSPAAEKFNPPYRRVDAASPCTTPDFTPRLVLVGKKAWKFDQIIDSAGRNEFAGDIVFTGYVEDAVLPAS